MGINQLTFAYSGDRLYAASSQLRRSRWWRRQPRHDHRASASSRVRRRRSPERSRGGTGGGHTHRYGDDPRRERGDDSERRRSRTEPIASPYRSSARRLQAEGLVHQRGQQLQRFRVGHQGPRRQQAATVVTLAGPNTTLSGEAGIATVTVTAPVPAAEHRPGRSISSPLRQARHPDPGRRDGDLHHHRAAGRTHTINAIYPGRRRLHTGRRRPIRFRS